MDYGCRIMFEYFGCKIAVGRVRLLLYEMETCSDKFGGNNEA